MIGMVSLGILLSLGTLNIKAAVAAPISSSSSVELPQITSISIKPGTPTQIANSKSFVTDGQTLEFNLLDAYGNPVSYGNYSGTVTVTGPAYFKVYDKTGKVNQSAELKVKNGVGKITLYVTTEAWPGEITITPHFRTLLNKSFIEKLYIPGVIGNAAQVVLKDTVRTQNADTFLTYYLQAEDARGNETPMNIPDLKASVLINGKPSTDVEAIPSLSENGSYRVDLKLINEELLSSFQIPVGDYTVTITPMSTSDVIFAPITKKFTVNAIPQNGFQFIYR